jgi:hypothetical protein
MHNIKTDGFNPLGGGFYDNEIKSSFYWLQADSDFAPFPNYFSARKTWKARALELCKGEGYEELRVEESSAEPWGSGRFVATRRGYILCASSGLSPVDALEVIQNKDK